MDGVNDQGCNECITDCSIERGTLNRVPHLVRDKLWQRKPSRITTAGNIIFLLENK
jgi:hypothetical protein